MDPDNGPLAIGEGSGPGRLPDPEVILAHFSRLLDTGHALRNKHVIVTAGATREAIDPVRFISNHSSGKMGVAIAAAAWKAGARVTLIAGHINVPAPTGADVVQVGTAVEMQQAVRNALSSADALIMAAAPADFQLTEPSAHKLKKGGGVPRLDLVETPDILTSTIPDRRQGAVIVGFALETDDVLGNARAKLRAKQLDIIVANRAGEPGEGFGGDTNRVTLIDKSDTVEELPLMSKDDVAAHLLDRVGALIDGRR